MKFTIYILTPFLTPLLALAGIFDTDDRLDYFEIKDSKVKELSKGSVAFIRKTQIKKMPDGNYLLTGKTLQQTFGFCEDANFANQPLNANCSGALIKSDTVLTAAHCVDEDLDLFVAVFGYQKSKKSKERFIIPSENVYELKKNLFYEFDTSFVRTGIDLALVQLKRATDRKPLEYDLKYDYAKGSRVFVLGYPLGVPMKLAPNGAIWSEGALPNSFRHDLDTFTVNSGSPVFDAASGKIIGVHVRGTGGSTRRYGRSCVDWHRAKRGLDYGAANTLRALQDKL